MTDFERENEPKPRARHDYSAEVHLNRYSLLRYLLLALGTLFLILGTIGVFLPVLPTTPFLLLTAACYARGSVTFYNWLMNNRFFGAYVRQWRHERRIPVKVKLLAIAMIVVTIGTSILYFIPIVAAKIVTGMVGVLVIAYIARFPS